MRIFCIIFFFSFNLLSILNSQCPKKQVIITTQLDIDSFIIKYPKCSELNASISIFDQTKQINNLFGLQNLIHINGSLVIYETEQLRDLSGLDSLISVTDYFKIEKCLGLESLKGLENLNLAGHLIIRDNPNLFSISHLKNYVGGGGLEIKTEVDSFELIQNLNLQLDYFLTRGNVFFKNIMLTNKRMRIIDMHKNKFISSYEDIKAISPDTINRLIVRNIPYLNTIGIEKFHKVDSLYLIVVDEVEASYFSEIDYPINLFLSGCNSFSDLDDIKDLEIATLSIGSLNNLRKLPELRNTNKMKYLGLGNNLILEDISGLSSVQSIERVDIVDNHNLLDCAIEPICGLLLDNPDEVLIMRNGGECVDVEDVLSVCISSNSSKSQFSLEIFPNPFNSSLNIRSNASQITIELFDSNSRNLNNIKIHGETTLELDYLNAGIYFIRISDGDNVLVKRIIKL